MSFSISAVRQEITEIIAGETGKTVYCDIVPEDTLEGYLIILSDFEIGEAVLTGRKNVLSCLVSITAFGYDRDSADQLTDLLLSKIEGKFNQTFSIMELTGLQSPRYDEYDGAFRNDMSFLFKFRHNAISEVTVPTSEPQQPEPDEPIEPEDGNG